MAFKATKNFTGDSGTEYKIGDSVKKEDCTERQIRSKRIEEGKGKKVKEVETPTEAPKTVTEDLEDVLLTEVSDEVQVEIETEVEDVNIEDEEETIA